MSTIEQSPPLPAAARTAPSATPGWQEQDGTLRDMWVRNATPQAIAEALGRSIPAIMTRAARLGLPRRAAPGRKPGARAATEGGNPAMARVTPRPKAAIAPREAPPQTSLRVCLMCLKKFESAGRHNRICSTCKNSAEYETASALPEIRLPGV